MRKKGTMDNGQLPEGWVVKKLGEVCKVERGSSPRPIKQYLTESEEGVNWIKIGDTKNVEKYIYKTKQKITKEGAKKSRYVKMGDFILSNSMSFGKPYIMGTDGYIHDGWFVLRLDNNIDTDYFYYLLSSDYVKNQFIKLASGAVVKNISSDLTKKALLPIPPLPEQKRIVTILDRAFKAIDQAKANAEQNLKNAKELFEGYLNRIFEEKGDDWEKKKIKELGKVQTGSTPPTKDKSNYGDFIPFAKPPHFKQNGEIDTGESMLSETGLKKGRQFDANSVLMVCIGATIGKTGFSNKPISSNQQINGLTPSKDYFPMVYPPIIRTFLHLMFKDKKNLRIFVEQETTDGDFLYRMLIEMFRRRSSFFISISAKSSKKLPSGSLLPVC